MLSVCIPVYNFNVSTLVHDIAHQLADSGINYEILLYDDGSQMVFKTANKPLGEISKVIYKELPENIGRARIRNLLANESSYSYLLFMDCDSLINNKNFINNYLNYITKSKIPVICGGRIYALNHVDKENLLRWKYGITNESKLASERSQVPSKSFMTNNFVIQKAIFETIRFNESLLKYGHEDTLFGFELWKNNIIPLHIENPVVNGDIETNTEFLRKTRQGIENLALIYKMLNFDSSFAQQVTLINYYNRFTIKHLLPLIFPLTKLFLHLLLRFNYAPVSVFNGYKLAYFGVCMDKIKHM